MSNLKPTSTEHCNHDSSKIKKLVFSTAQINLIVLLKFNYLFFMITIAPSCGRKFKILKSLIIP